MSKSNFHNFFAKFPLAAKAIIKFEHVALFFTGAFVLSCYAFIIFALLYAKNIMALQSCPLPAEPTVITTTYTITPDATDGVVDCSSLNIHVGATGKVIIDRKVTADLQTSNDWGVTLLVNNLTIDNGGEINANGKGYQVVETDPGTSRGGDSGGLSGGAGGGYGGAGGEGKAETNNASGAGGVPFGNQEQPSNLGASGGNGGSILSLNKTWTDNTDLNAPGTAFSIGLENPATNNEIKLLNTAGNYASDDQVWTSEKIDAGTGNSYQINKLTVNWIQDGSDNIQPKFQILASTTGAFTGEEVVFPAGASSYYQSGTAYPITSGTELDVSSQISTSYRYWKVKAIINTGANTTDTPIVSDITIKSSASNAALGGAGGGSLRITSTGTVTIDGSVLANGLDGQSNGVSAGGGGSGGSVWIDAAAFAGSGVVSANGGGSPATTYRGGGGGGGRIIMFCTDTNNFTGTTSVAGGVVQPEAQNGGVGTILGPTCKPAAPTILTQLKSDNTNIPVGGILTQNTIVFAGNLADPDLGDHLSLQVEVEPLGTPFSNVPTYTQATGSTNPQSCSTPPTDCGKIVVTNLTLSREYHWQARVRDDHGGFSSWTSYGANAESSRDFLLTGSPANIALISGNNQTGTVFTNLSAAVVKVTDSNGFPIPGYSVNWGVSNDANGGNFVTATTITDNNGEASNIYKLGKNAGSNTFYASSSGLNGTPVVFTATGTPDSLNHFAIQVPQVTLVNQNFTVSVQAFDQYNNTKTNYTGTVTFTAQDPLNPQNLAGGNLTPSNYTFVSGDNGQKTFSNFQYDNLQSIKIKVTDGTVSQLSTTIAVVNSFGTCPDVDGIIDVNQTWVADASNHGVFDCRGFNLNINNNAILTLQSYNNGDADYTNDYGDIILTDNLTIAQGSSIVSDNQGYGTDAGFGAGKSQGDGGGGGSYGGYGGYGTPSQPGSPYGDLRQPFQLGSGGGTGSGFSGGPGGGAIKLDVTGTITLDGTISANGGNGSVYCGRDGGGGSGGSIWLKAANLTKSAGTNPLIRANGGVGGVLCAAGGSGSGGRIAIFASSSDSLTTDASTSIQAAGGVGGNQTGGPGTYYYEGPSQTAGQGLVKVNNRGNNSQRAAISGTNQTYTFENINLTGYGHLELTDSASTINLLSSSALTGDGTAQLYSFGTINALSLGNIADAGLVIENTGVLNTSNTLTVTNSLVAIKGRWNNIQNVNLNALGNLTLYASATGAVNGEFNFGGNLNVSSSSVVTMVGNTVSNTGVTVDFANITVASGGVITADAQGFGSASGPGKGGSDGGGGGSYGGYGGNSGSAPGSPYGDLTKPSQLGSGGGTGGGYLGGTGGGAIKLVASNTLTLDGTISSNGSNGASFCGRNGGGGSGGSIWIVATHLAKNNGTSPVIRTNGATGGTSCGPGGSGSGGRIAIFASSSDSLTTNVNTSIQSRGGVGGSQTGGPGTYYYEGPSQTPGQGLVKVNNGGNNSQRAAISGTNQTYTFENINLTGYGQLELTDSGSTINLLSTNALSGDGTAQLYSYGTINALALGNISDAGLYIEPSGVLNTSATVTVTNALVTIEGRWNNIQNVNLAANGDLTLYASATGFVNGEFNFGGNLTVSSTSIVTLVGDKINNRGVTIDFSNITVATGGVISADGQGFGSASGPGRGGSDGGGGGSYGGYGGNSGSGPGTPYGDLTQPSQLGSGGGTGGGYPGGNGGGAMKINVSNTFTLDGTITNNGFNGASFCGRNGGGGSGGSIWIVATNLLKSNGTSPIVRANGATGGTSCGPGGSGSGGRIAIFASNTDTLTTDANTAIQSRGGIGGSQTGGPGTYYYEGPSQVTGQGIVRADNGGNNSQRAAISGTNQSYTFEKIILTGYGQLELTDPGSTINIMGTNALTGDGTAQLISYGTINALSLGNISNAGLFIQPGGVLNTSATVTVTNALVTMRGTWSNTQNLNLSTQGSVTLYADATGAVNGAYNFGGNLNISATGTLTMVGNTVANTGVTIDFANITVAAGGVISADGQGYGSGSGPGAGYYQGDGGGGASFGGYGGYGNPSQPGVPYGDLRQPWQLGSGGGVGGGYPGGTGGGAIKINVSNTFTLDGTVTSVGTNGAAFCGRDGGGGSGGAIWITAATMTKTSGTSPVVRSNGGLGAVACGAGGSGSGGRIALYVSTSDTFTTDVNTSIQARGGVGGSQVGGPGTFYYEGPSQTPGQGIVKANNGGYNTQPAVISGTNQTYTFEKIDLSGYGHLQLTDVNSTVNITGANALAGDGTAQLISYGTVNAPSLGSISNAGLYIEPSGVLNTSNTVNVSNATLTIRGTWSNVQNITLGANGNLTLYADASGITNGEYNFGGDFNISSTSVVTLLADRTNGVGVTLDFANINLAQGGNINADGQGYGSDTGPGAGLYQGDGGGGASYGGYGGNGNPSAAGTPYGDFRHPVDLGSGGGTGSGYPGGTGGGAIKINASNSFTLDGTISAAGTNGAAYCGRDGGGASGGSIWITAANLLKTNGTTPVIRANGGLGAVACGAGGSGSGGRIAIYASNSDTFISQATIQTRGGIGGANYGGPGTFYYEGPGYTSQVGDLTISNDGYSGRGMDFNAQQYNLHSLHIGSNVRDLAKADTNAGTGVVFNLTGDFTLDVGALIDGKYQGYSSDTGPGKGQAGLGQSGGAGGAFGGNGGNGESDGGNPIPQGGNAYGSQRQPLSIGSGGGRAGTGALGGKGGGAVAVIARDGVITLNGTIDVSGETGHTASPGGGGGAGGSILIEGATCSIGGSLTAQGGNGGNDIFDGGGGGGGRISILYTQGPCNVIGSVSVAFGTSSGGQSGQIGTYPNIQSIPNVPAIKDQLHTDGVTAIPVGGETSEQQVKFKASVSDPDPSAKNLQAEFEVVPVSSTFTGSSTLFAPAQTYTGTQLLEEASTAGLTPGQQYKWRVRVLNVSEGISSNWAEFGGNSDTQADYTVSSVAALDIATNKTNVNTGETITLTVTAKDGSNNPDGTYTGTVTFTSTSATAGLPVNYVFSSGDNGVHIFNNQAYFSQPGTYTITVTDVNNPVLTATTANIVVTESTQALTINPSKTNIVTGEAINLTVAAKDGSNVTDPNYRGTVHFTSTAGVNGTLPVDYTYIAGDNGSHTFTNSVSFGQPGTYTVTVTDSFNGSLTATTANIVVTAATQSLTLVPSSTSIIAGQTIDLVVTAKDGSNNTDTSYRGTVSFTSTSANTVVPADYTYTSGDNGAHSFNAILFPDAGTFTITVHDSVTGISYQSVPIVVSSTTQSMSISVNKTAVVTGEPISVTVNALNGSNNPDPNYRGTVSFNSSSATASVPPNYTYIGADNGTHVFSNQLVFTQVGTYTITAFDTVNGTLTATSQSIVVSTSATSLSILPTTTTVNVGEPLSLTVTANNVSNNPDGYYRETVHFTSTAGANGTLPSNYTFTSADSGTHVFTNSVIFSAAGTYTITATDTLNGLLTATTTNITVNAVAQSLSIVPSKTIVTVGELINVTVTAKDSGNNTNTAYTGTVHFISNSSGGLLPADYTYTVQDAGVHTFTNSVKFTQAGTFTISVQDSVTGNWNVSPAITVTASTQSLTISPSTTHVTVGTFISLTVNARDGSNNLDPNYTGTVTFTSTAGSNAILPADYTYVPTDNGTYTFNNGLIFTQPGTYTVTVRDTTNNTLVANTVPITVDAVSTPPSTATHFSVLVNKTNVLVGDTITLTVRVLDSSNNIVTTYTRPIIFSANSSGAILPSNYMFVGSDQGIHSFANAVWFTASGTYRVTVKDAITPTISGVSPNIYVTGSGTQTNNNSDGTDFTISNVNVTPDIKSATICWHTDLPTKGTIMYGTASSGKLTGASLIEDAYTTSHCITLYNLAEKTGYIYRITATSQAGQSKMYDSTFATKEGLVPNLPASGNLSCIDIESKGYAFNNKQQAIVTYTTKEQSTCVFSYGLKSDNLPFSMPSSTGKSHLGIIDLTKADGKHDIIYKVSCTFTDTQTNKQTTCTANNIIPVKSYCQYTKCSSGGNANNIDAASLLGGALVLFGAIETVALVLSPFTSEAAGSNIAYMAFGFIDRLRKRIPWGIVYDSVTKKYLSRAIVRLYDVHTGKLIQTAVTDAMGIFKMTPKKGTYIIKVTKTGYTFPSTVVVGTTDRSYMNVYHGEQFEITEANQPLAITIPLDAINPANTAKVRSKRILSWIEFILEKVSLALLIFGVVFSVIASILTPSLQNILVLVLYGMFLTIKLYLLSMPQFGKVKMKGGKAIPGVEVGLYETEFDTIITKTYTDQKGQYILFVPNANYYLRVMDSQYKTVGDKVVVKKDARNNGIKVIKNSITVV